MIYQRHRKRKNGWKSRIFIIAQIRHIRDRKMIKEKQMPEKEKGWKDG